MNILFRRFPPSTVGGAFAAGLAVLLLSVGGPASAQTVAEIATYKGPDRQARLEAGARKEGKVLVYGIDTQTEGIYEAIQKKYPFIKVELYRAGGEDVTRRIIEEYKVGRFDADALAITLGGLHVMRDAGMLQSFYSPEMEHYRPDAIEPNRNWVIVHESYNGLGWNTKHFKENEVPQTYDDLLDPKWKGKFAVSARSTTFAQWIGVVKIEKGEDFIRRFAKQDVTLYQLSARALANLVVSGEVPISPTIFSAHVRNDQGEGAPVAWRALGPVFANNVSMALPAKSAHPHAAMLVMDFQLAKEGQLMRQKLGYASPRLDMPSVEKPGKVYQLPERPNFEQEEAEWQALVRQVFGRPKEGPKEGSK